MFYQFWLNLPDADAAKMALVFSFKPVAEIKVLIDEHETATHLRKLQKALAEELTVLVHSEEDLAFAKQASDILFSQTSVDALRTLNEQQLLEVMDGVKQVNGSKELLADGLDLVSFLADSGIFASKGEARKMLQGGGISINKEKVTTPDYKLTEAQLLNGKYMLVQKGKKDYTLAIFG
jgi:tyrosyl-tRNA synthetase